MVALYLTLAVVALPFVAAYDTQTPSSVSPSATITWTGTETQTDSGTDSPTYSHTAPLTPTPIPTVTSSPALTIAPVPVASVTCDAIRFPNFEGCPVSDSGDVCIITACADGAGGAPVSSSMPVCEDGEWIGTPRGCEQVTGALQTVPACPRTRYEGYGVCDAAYSGTTCPITTCDTANGFSSGPTSIVMPTCQNNGTWTGSATGCTKVNTLPVCSPPIQTAYFFDCVDKHHGETCRPTGCSTGHVVTSGATVGGSLWCKNGEWAGDGFTGCEVDPGASFAACSSPLTVPTGYESINCTGGQAHLESNCDVTCAADYDGEVQGTAVCFDGAWFSSYSGCTKRCRLPAELCDDRTGKLAPNFTVKGVFAEQFIDEQCFAKTRGKIPLFRASCAHGFALEGDSDRYSTGASLCLNGEFVGGFKTYGLPKCAKKEDVAERKCTCGDSGALSKSASLAISGLVRRKEYVAGSNEWLCDTIGTLVTCRCQC